MPEVRTITAITSLVLLLVVSAVVWKVVLGSNPEQEILQDTARFNEWQERINEVGGAAAFEELTSSIAGLAQGAQHEHAHVFGGALYLAEGVSGLAVCDERFDYGCFHEFLGRAITEQGIPIVYELNESCIETLGEDAHFCHHGLGHGVQAHFGYRDSDLDKALEACDGLRENDPIGGCNGGVFMEYNLRTMLGSEGTVRTSETPFAPCDRLESKYLQACYFWQPQWWLNSVAKQISDSEKQFAYVGSLCTDMAQQNRDLEKQCFRGIGNILRVWDGGRLTQMCDVVSADEQLREACWKTARD